jgi:DNA repair photolyase
MKKCKEQGFLTGVNYIPVLPFLSDSDEQLDKMIRTAKDYGADFAFVGALTLFGKGPTDCKTLYYKVLQKMLP